MRAASVHSPSPSLLSEAEELSALIGTVYDAALEPAVWPAAVEQASKFVGCSAGVVGAADTTTISLNMMIPWGYEPHYWQRFIDHYMWVNPFNAAVARSRIGQLDTQATHERYVDWLASDFYLEWARPQGFIDGIQITLDKSASGLAVFGCFRRESESRGLIGDAEIRRMRLIFPHFRRAVLIGKVLDLQTMRAAAFGEAIDGLATAVFLLSQQGALVHANRSGEAMLEAEDPLKLVRGMLTGADEGIRRALNEVFAAASGEAGVETDGIAAALVGRGGDHFTAHILPLTSGARQQTGANFSAVAALFVRKAIIDLSAAIGAATQLYGFTPAEERVLSAVIEIGGVARVAAELGVAKRTVQTHLEHLFEKTGSRRQADLVKLIAGYDAPVRRRNRK